MMQLGIDYASIDGNDAPNWTKVYGAGARFAIIRKSFMLTDARHMIHLAPDMVFERDAAHARLAGLTVGAYGFFSFSSNAPSAADQVHALIHSPGEVLRGKDLPYCVDVEFPGRGIADTGRSRQAAFAFLLEIVAEVRRQAGVSPLIYTSHVQWHDDNGLGGLDAPELDGCQLWIKTPYRMLARRPVDKTTPYPPHVGPMAADPHDYWRVPKPWERQGWWVQQYQGDAVGFPGFNQTVDISQFSVLDHSSTDQFRIRWLQQAIGIKTTGVWDVVTSNALDAYQRSHGIQSSGLVDVETFASLSWRTFATIAIPG